MQLVGPRLGDDREQPAGREPVLGLVGRGRHLELADRVHREVLPRLAHLGPGVVHAVDDEAVRVFAGAGAEVDVAAIEEAADVVLRGAGRQHRQIDPPPRRDRQILDLLGGHRRRHVGRVTSTIGDSPVTVTVSDSVAGFSEKLMIAVWSMMRTMSGRVSVLNPVSSVGHRVAAGRQRRQAEFARAVGHGRCAPGRSPRSAR